MKVASVVRSFGLSAVVFATACGSMVAPTGDAGPDGGTCTLPNGSVCRVGMSCPAGDGCNSCTCTPSGVACTLLACLDGGPPDIVVPPDSSRPDAMPTDGPITDVPPPPDGGACVAMDARGQGPCPAILGYAWNGTRCDSIGGCSCVGRDCPSLLRSMEACTVVYASCVTGPRTCTTPGGDCGTGAMCLGVNTCRVRVGLCVAPRPCTRDLAPYCGCDGVTFHDSSTCPQQNYQHTGPCPGGTDGGVPDSGTVDAGPRGCTTTADCPPSSVCEGLGCGTPDGMCVDATRPCLADLAPYCGCDGTTFHASSSCANRRYAHRGACP